MRKRIFPILVALSIAPLFADGVLGGDVDILLAKTTWSVKRGAAVDPALRAKQAWTDAAGLHVSLDASESSLRPWNWGVVECSDGLGTFRDGDVLELRADASAGTLLSADANLVVRGANGNRIWAERTDIRRGGAEYVFVFRLDSSKSANLGWGAPKEPFALHGIAFGFRREKGEARFLSLRRRGKAGLAEFQAQFIEEELKLDAKFPWSPPFGPASEVVIVPESPEPGEYTLSVGSFHGRFGDDFHDYRAMLAAGETTVVFKTEIGADRTPMVIKDGFMFKGRKIRAHRVVAKIPVTVAGELKLDVDTGNPIHVLRSEANERAVLVFLGRGAKTRRWEGSLVMADDSDAKAVRRELSFTTPAHGETRFTLPGMPRKGLWRVRFEVRAEDGSTAELETRFAQIDLHRATPQLPFGQFRIGVNYHQQIYSKEAQCLCNEALVAGGFKLARLGGPKWTDVNSQSAQFDWSETDRIVEDIERLGVASDRGIFALWDLRNAMKRNRMDDYYRFYERLSEHYGTRFDYYEIGNEWDLMSEDRFPLREAIDVQRRIYTALKRGNPSVRVMHNGWALENSDNPMITQKGFQESFMRETRGFSDVNPIHVHGSWWDFPKRMEKFFNVRRDCGVDVPWFANETALSNDGGESEVADCIWKKVVWCWAKGSTDFCWYNLRATGWNPKDGEMQYGLLTADFYPRYGYAAFAALTKLLNGAEFMREIISSGMPTLYVFRLTKSRGVAVVGWNDLSDESFEVGVKSDAKNIYKIDLYGNRNEIVRRSDDRDEWSMWTATVRPSALLLDGATAVETRVIGDPIVMKFPTLRIGVGVTTNRPPEMVLESYAQVHQYYEANPEMTHRLWKGRDDLSARAWLTKTARGVGVFVRVRDEYHAEGDGVRLFIEENDGRSQEIDLGLGRREGSETIYEREVPCCLRDLKINLIVLDADAEGLDGSMKYSRHPVGIRE